MYAIFITGGKQYRAAEGETIFVEKLEGEAGQEVVFDQETKDFMNLVVSNLIESLQEIEEMYPNHLKVKIEK